MTELTLNSIKSSSFLSLDYISTYFMLLKDNSKGWSLRKRIHKAKFQGLEVSRFEKDDISYKNHLKPCNFFGSDIDDVG